MVFSFIALLILGIPCLLMLPRTVRWIIAIMSLLTGWFSVLIILQVIIAELLANHKDE